MRWATTTLGLGIGLTVARALVRSHGGDIVAQSAGARRGSQFIVTLPLAANAQRAASGRGRRAGGMKSSGVASRRRAAARAGAPRAAPRPRPGHRRPTPRQNRLLALLPDGEWQRWQPQLELVTLPLGRVLYESGATLSHAYFPTSAIVSLQFVTENGATAQIAVVGNEGIVGIPLFMGGGSTPSQAVVQSAGDGLPHAGPAHHRGLCALGAGDRECCCATRRR